jgi:hypothetical protein
MNLIQSNKVGTKEMGEVMEELQRKGEEPK